ncbi:MAG: site-specific DNA-methyltransferase [Planctomycetota bacterium]|nr:site-specific DNA-methyltransferase [Planctomycetota bacterium]
MSTGRDAIVCGDCLDVLEARPAGFADLAYVDPPFNTGRHLTAARARYADRWPDVEAYLAFLRPRLEAAHRALTPRGSILLHCDWRTVHHLRLLLDDLFGIEFMPSEASGRGGGGFVNHLVWVYGLGGSSRRRFARKHDDILFYAKSAEYYFHPPLVPATSNRMKGQMKKATDVIEVPSINNMAAERVGYPTQKPLALLELLIGACCPEGGLVLDPFCGSGTALVAARRLDRRALGIDISPDAVDIARARLEEAEISLPRL